MKKTRCPLSCILYFLFAVHYLLFAAPATAQEEARLYVEPAQIAAKTEEIFVAKIRLAPGGECVNAAEIILSFDQKSLEIVDFSRGESIISLWTDSPSREKIALANESGNLSFSGGIPGGFCQNLTNPASPEIAKIAFKPRPRAGDSAIEILPSSRLYLNDGEGTQIAPQVFGGKVVSMQGIPKIGEWEKFLENDRQPPDDFEIQVRRDPAIFDNQFFIIFLARDKQTGIAKYEVSETPLNDPGAPEKWQAGESPYLLRDQSLRSKIKVKAIDLAGNEKIAEYAPGTAPVSAAWQWFVIAAILAIAVFIAIQTKKNNAKK